MQLFENTLDQPYHEEDFDVNELNILNNNHSPSFRKIIEYFFTTDEPTAIQHHLFGIVLNQISAKVK